MLGFSFIVLPILLVPIILQYSYHWSFTTLPNYTFSIYSIYLFVYTIIQYTLSYLNNHVKYEKRFSTEPTLPSCNIIVAGWKEDEQYFKMCLESIRSTFCNVINVQRVLVIIDGDEPDDDYMVDIFCDVFAETSFIKSCHIHLDPSMSFENVANLPQYQSSNAICITQKHEGKRSCMYTGFQLSLIDAVETVFSTDSDTVLSSECLPNMFTVLLNDSQKAISGICGNLGIYNKYSSIISFLSSLRYFYAFNIERAYQSFNGYVLCISGPIGLYRLDYVSKVLDAWKNQTFLGKPCTYGDDRHLTNKLLSLNSRIVYTPLSTAETETPSTFYRFFKQQTRWNKSSIREFFWTYPFVDHYSLFLTLDLTYTIIFPLVVIGWLFYLLFAGTMFQLGLYSCMFIGIGIIKSIYAACVYHQLECLFYFLYAYIYVGITFPSRLWALLNISDTNWGTTMRLFRNQPYTADLLVPLVWNSTLLSGLAFSFYRNYHAPLGHYLLFFLPHLVSTVGFLIMYAYIQSRSS
jgi:hyaluronan synthase